jgi:folate-binding Fe-S cluster repair protein YgfZ
MSSRCKPGQGAYGALLTPQGKILFDMFTLATETGFLLDAATGSADDLVKRLTMYRLRRKIEIAPRPDLGVAAIWGSDEPPDIEGARTFRDPRAAGWAIAPSALPLRSKRPRPPMPASMTPIAWPWASPTPSATSGRARCFPTRPTSISSTA